MNTSDISWEQISTLPSCGLAALGDPRLLGDEAWLQSDLPYLHTRRSGYGMVYGRAECDGLPVEVGVRRSEVVAARLEFTNDASELEAASKGHWRHLGRLRIGPKGAVALDAKYPDLDAWCHPLPLPMGWYAAEAFTTQDDHIGVRLIADT